MSPSYRSYATDQGFWIDAASWVPWEKQSVTRSGTLIFRRYSQIYNLVFWALAAESGEMVRIRDTDVAVSISRPVVFPTVAALVQTSLILL
jgi:hypothetical protein